jgi:arginyl-tRNA synthetase
MKEIISQLVAKNLPGYEETDVLQLIEIPMTSDHGDFALPCFTIAKQFKKSPIVIAKNLQEAMEQEVGVTSFLNKMEVVNGYLNFYVNKEFYINSVLSGIIECKNGISEEGKGKTICMDYSSPNIAKNFHVGHLRTTVIGNSLYHIYKKLGYHVVRINYLGDWGTQFGKQIVAYHMWSSKEQVEKDGIQELLRIYVKFNEEAEKTPELIEQARAWFVRMEQGDEEALALWQWFKEISMLEYERIYDMLQVEFDSYVGESFYKDKVSDLVDELKQKNLLEDSQGAYILSLEEYQMPPCLIMKKDGGSIYHSRDIAAAINRKKEYQFEQCLYVTGSEQSLHFAQVFQAIEKMGYDWHQQLVHVPYGLVSLDGEKLSSRQGNIVYAEDILKEAVIRASNLIEEKNPNLKDKDSVAKKVGIGAVIFHDLCHQRIKNVDFSWAEVLSFEGSTGPYVQYTYARAKSILRKAQEVALIQEIDVKCLMDEASFQLIKELSSFEVVVKDAAKRYEPSLLARYVLSLATAFNQFYRDCNILNAEIDVKQARLCLVNLVQNIIQQAMGLLGIECPEEM